MRYLGLRTVPRPRGGRQRQWCEARPSAALRRRVWSAGTGASPTRERRPEPADIGTAWRQIRLGDYRGTPH